MMKDLYLYESIEMHWYLIQWKMKQLTKSLCSTQEKDSNVYPYIGFTNIFEMDQKLCVFTY